MKQPGFHAGVWITGVSLLLLLSGCGKTTSSSVQDQSLVPGKTAEQKPVAASEKIERPAETVAPPGPPEERVTEPAATVREQLRSDREQPSASPPSQPLALSDVFFDFDRAVIRDDAKPVLEANARLLRADDGTRLTIEGHCDERGTLEYNLVLGEKRAHAVKQYLSDLGVVASRIQVTSFGKEKPFCTEHSQECWQKNRRAHFSPQ
jgi:peptidoglycan-associated lipoprotein